MPTTLDDLAQEVRLLRRNADGGGDVEGGTITAYDSTTGIATIVLDNGDTVFALLIPMGGGAATFPITFDDGTYTHSLRLPAPGVLRASVTDDATGNLLAAMEAYTNGTDLSVVDFDAVSNTSEILLELVASDSSGAMMILHDFAAPNQCNVHLGSGSPNTVLSAPKGSLFIDLSTPALYQNTNGSTAWSAVGGSASPLTTKGDLYGYSTVGTRVPVGANGSVLTADSTDAEGLIWQLGETYAAQSQASAATIDFATARVHRLTLTGSPVALTLSGATSGIAAGLTLYLVQDGTGSRLVTWPGSVKWPAATAPVLSTAANAVDLVVMETFDGGTTWYANLAGKGYT